MPKIKFTKGELKRQRDSLKQFERYLPTLQLKKQQLQLEILRLSVILAEKTYLLKKKEDVSITWAGLLSEAGQDFHNWLVPLAVITSAKNVSGVDLKVFERLDFSQPEYDLFTTPLWVDFAIEALRGIVSLRKEIEIIEKGMENLRHELRITTQRLNLFEKIKIPQAMEAIRLIKIYIGDQMANAVGRSKIAKRKIEETELAFV